MPPSSTLTPPARVAHVPDWLVDRAPLTHASPGTAPHLVIIIHRQTREQRGEGSHVEQAKEQENKRPDPGDAEHARKLPFQLRFSGSSRPGLDFARRFVELLLWTRPRAWALLRLEHDMVSAFPPGVRLVAVPLHVGGRYRLRWGRVLFAVGCDVFAVCLGRGAKDVAVGSYRGRRGVRDGRRPCDSGAAAVAAGPAVPSRAGSHGDRLEFLEVGAGRLCAVGRHVGGGRCLGRRVPRR
ncbi:hypothetical protein B0T24DRAFT_61272 [Lasiosphaeria ovina]|uniref:Uncharacterized protein n=1 Tax=Lasiosphaeria ovina TaxID=92902 RepID=A0AAE0NLP7_9PEZI|nr:hypothetical protein B0T24DRAFT_61272 [Lasiosphaeria ovina]